MAVRVPTTPPPVQIQETSGATYQPDPGNLFSTVEVRRVQVGVVIVEHPDGWTDAQLSAAVGRRGGDIASRADFWSAAPETELVEVARGMAEMEDGEDMVEPFLLTPEDLTAPAPVPVVTPPAAE